MEFQIHYRGWPENNLWQSPTGSIAVVDEQVLVRTQQQSLLVAYPTSFLLLLLLFSFCSLILLNSSFDLMICSVSFSFWRHLLLPMAILLAFIICVIPVKRRRIVLRLNDIVAVRVYGREILLQTAGYQYVFTAQTTTDAHALEKAIQSGEAISIPVQFGRESLLDGSGFILPRLVTLTVGGGDIILTGRAMLSNRSGLVVLLVLFGAILLPIPILSIFMTPVPGWTILVCYAGFVVAIIALSFSLKFRKPLVRSLALADLREIATIRHLVTFLAPDDKLRERRYTLPFNSLEEAEMLARHLRNEDEAQVTFTIKTSNNTEGDTASRRFLLPRTGEGSMRSGSVVFDKDYITFTGRAGLAHPWTWCLAAALAVLASVPLALLFSHFATPMHLELSELIIISCFPAIIVALLAVYLPASVLLPFLFGRITLARKQITHFERMGREVTCWISSSEYQYQYLNLVFATDIEAELFYDIVRS